ncbi:hypothetical protein BO70DRAFT_389274 [Aspergillus heteromorphus CBS 117.55]|uniref:Yeast cell wall synthesis Kre9/Knh1-like N-terminal domain-containing protein n=1 Tax=Aspergillus heteromorphus CBS 117.55 TaxID=1448321 RepID=A0A317VIF2_9EURO|nr:uncharacterized protein BO70DRAFT_389274 [Aspergillus heteromorphus CBS 117.55]PWY72967.1 hypothetical protein BO70DRAFT_389274 [Aspergillus heteromorphus CBS 117.55]
MRLSHAVSLLPLAAFVGALNVTSPTKGEDVDLSKSFTVTWTSVDTDPTSFNIYLVNNAIYPSVDTKLASDVETSKGSYTISSVSGVTDGDGYQINLMSDSTQNTGILAQSNQFTVDGSASSSSSSTLSTSASSTGTSSSTSSSTGTSTASTTSTGTASSSSSSSSQGSTTTSSNTTTSSGSSTSGCLPTLLPLLAPPPTAPPPPPPRPPAPPSP